MAEPEYNEPWVTHFVGVTLEPRISRHLWDNTGSRLAVFDCISQGMAADARMATRAARCVSFLAGVPDAVLDAPTDEALMARAALRGEPAAALAMADWLHQYHSASADGREVVTRGDLFTLIRDVVAAADRSVLGEPLHPVNSHLVPVSGRGDNRLITVSHELVESIRRVLAAEGKA